MTVTEIDMMQLTAAIEIARANIEIGGGPFGAVVVLPDGATVGAGNRVASTPDPTAHAEITAIRVAAQDRGIFDLSGSTLYSSCEPCPMCLGAILWARIDRVVWAADRHDAAAAGFDDLAFYSMLVANPVADWRLERVPVTGHPLRLLPFDVWRERIGIVTPY